ncbi:MAG: RHS repeat protein [Acidobacteria bacterium]|nr:RHS repeat protein [Acidobacteriota bacterium]
MLILSLLILPNSSFAFTQLSSLASSAIEVSSVPIHYLPSLLRWLFKSKPVQSSNESFAERAAAVSRLQISPSKFVGYQGQTMKFNALPLNTFNKVIQGVKLSWESSDTNKMQIDDSGKATFLQPGRVVITCRAGTASAVVPVQVRPGNRPAQSDDEWKNDQETLSADGTTTGSLLPKLFNKLMPTVKAQNNSNGNDFGYDELYSDAKNLTGSPLNRVIEGTRLGAVLPEGSNFEFSVPLVSLGGRGIGTDIALFYNSRVWSRRNNVMAFDAVNGEPSPGFTLGFGRIVAYQSGANYRLIWVEADGTRHYLGQGSYSTTQTYTTTDGSDISYTGNVAYGGTISYPNGTTLLIQVINNRLLPTQITDRNNNYISISYKDGLSGFSPNAIDFVTDTLGRVVQFNYDSSSHLTSIVAPGFGGTSTNPVSQTIAQFDYQTVNVTTNFSGLSIERWPSSSTTSYLKHIYFPATNNGYLFTYSGYGMIYNVSMRRGMSINGQGVISDGTENAAVAFNYPTSGSTLLTDAPAFTQRTETAVSAPTATFTYSSSTDTMAQTQTFTITRPDSTNMNLTRSTNSSSIANGLLTQTEIKSGATSFAKSVVNYVTAANAARVQSVIAYDETNTPTKVDFDYDSSGNLINKREYGYPISGNWQVRRRTHFTYNTSLGIQGLVTLTEVFDALQNTNDADDVLIAKSSVTYDDYQAMGGLENYGGTANPPGHLAGNPKGNVTGTTQWYDLANNLSITRLMKYDIFGNVLKEQVSCCNLKTFVIPESNGYAMPQEVMSGDASGVHLTETTDTDFNTGVIWRQTDARGKQVTYDYDAALRMRQMNLFTGATASAAFNDSSLSVSSTVTYTEDGTTKNLTTTKNFDGWHRLIAEVNAYGAQVNTTYNAMGQVASVTNPFAVGGTPSYATSYQYDALGRQTLVTLPDNNTVQTSYSGATVTITDPVNRKLKRESDGFGRLIKVSEPDVTTGALTQDTLYSYNLLDKLTGVNQGNQTRAWKYDDAGRMLFERIPEQTASINDGSGTLWTTQYTYTSFNAVATKLDARGVVTSYSYDALNRLTGITYNTSGASGVATTPSVTMTYDTNQTSATNGLLLSLSLGSSYSESYSYDPNNRLASLTRTIDTQSYTTSYQYNPVNQMTKLTYPSSYAYYLYHDNLGRLQALSPNAPGGNGNSYYLSNLSYNTAGQVTGLTLGNGVVESYGYDAQRLQLTSQTATKTSTTLMNLSYTYAASAGQSGAGSTAGNSGQLMSITGSIGGASESAA